MSEGRTALGITVLLIASLTVPTILFGDLRSGFAQQGSPSPSGTAPQIELLNPSSNSNVVSDKDSDPSANTDATDTQYHFNAWARNIPADPLVEFFIIQGNSTILLGSSTLKGSDTFDVFAAIPDTLEDTDLDVMGDPTGNTAVVRAVLYANNGAQEVDRDEQTVIVNQKPDPAGDQLMQGERNRRNPAETIEMTYPVNTGVMGFFTQQGQQPTGVVEVTTSADTNEVAVSYTTSPVGTEPNWVDCNSTNESRANAADGVRCTLQSGVRPDQVTAMAVVAMDEESSAPGGQQPREIEKNAGDAHRADGFEQEPAAVFVSSHTVPAASMPGCSPVVTVSVQDGTGREVVNAQVDVHAQGPHDNLWFNTHDAETDAAGDPDSNDAPENHTTESGRRCSDGTFGGTQGDHEIGGGFDRKHIESTDRTDDNGEFTYRMYGEVPGGTTMTAWVDRDDDDRFCSTERSGSGTITWGSGGPAAPPAEGAEIQTCPAPTPTPTGSPPPTGSPSPTPPPTVSPTPSPTGSVSPTPTPSPTGSATATPTPTPTATPTGTPPPTATTGGTTPSPQPAAREITLEASESRKTFGRRFTLSGTVESSSSACTDFVSVQILRDVLGGNDNFETFATEQTDANGAFTASFDADMSANYIAQVAETPTCGEATSDAQPVLVRVKVFLGLSDGRVERGDRVRIKIRTAPCPATARDRVLLFRAIEGEFGKSGRKRSNGACRATFVRRIRQNSVFQGRWPKQAPEFLTGESRSKAVRVIR